MKRWAANLFCLFSLLVFVSSVTIWVRSYSAIDAIQHWKARLEADELGTRKHIVGQGVASRNGVLVLWREHYVTDPSISTDFALGWRCSSGGPADTPAWDTALARPTDLHFAGLRLSHISEGSKALNFSHDAWSINLPLWLFLPAAVPPFLWWRKWRKRDTRGFPMSIASDAE